MKENWFSPQDEREIQKIKRTNYLIFGILPLFLPYLLFCSLHGTVHFNIGIPSPRKNGWNTQVSVLKWPQIYLKIMSW